MTNQTTTIDLYTELARDGYPYSCSCGEAFRDSAAAITCRKCRKYLEDDVIRRVYLTDPLDGEYVEIVDPWTFDGFWIYPPA